MTNEEGLYRVQEERSLMETIRRCQHNWLSHIMRHDNLLNRVIEGRLKGKKTHGRPRKVFLDDAITNCGAGGHGQMKRLAQDRNAWRDSAKRG